MPSAGWRLLALQSAYGPLASASAARRPLLYAEPRARLLPPRNLDKCMPRPPGAAAPGKMGGGGRKPWSPERRRVPGRGGGGEGGGRMEAEGAGGPLPGEPRGRLHTFPGRAETRAAQESSFQCGAAAGSREERAFSALESGGFSPHGRLLESRKPHCTPCKTEASPS